MDYQNYILVKSRIFKHVQDRLIRKPGISDSEVIKLIESSILEDEDAGKMASNLKIRMRKELFNRIRRMDVLTELLEDDTVTEIMVNGPNNIFVERQGRIIDSGLSFESKERLFDIAGQIASAVNRTVNVSNPILDARTLDGARVNIVLEPVAINGTTLTIRRFPSVPVDGERLIELGSISREVLGFLAKLVRAKYNLLISGGTGSGKTTFLNVLSSFIPKDERIITIEDSAELKIIGISNLVSLETRNGNGDGCKEITIRDLIKTALRMRPDRIIVGEVRGEEAIDMLQAFSVGQDGSLSTIHANHAEDALYRLETMIMLSTHIPIEALRRQIAAGVDIIVQLGRLRDKSRHVLEVREVIGMNNKEIETSLLYSFKELKEEEGIIIGEMVKENDLVHKEKLYRSGLDL